MSRIRSTSAQIYYVFRVGSVLGLQSILRQGSTLNPEFYYLICLWAMVNGVVNNCVNEFHQC